MDKYFFIVKLKTIKCDILWKSFSISLQAAKLPMSIIIVGVGQAEFDGIYQLIVLTSVIFSK